MTTHESLTFPARIAERFPTREVRIGSLAIGARNPILLQSMTIADTLDTDAVVAEILGLAEAGCPLVRVTAPSIRDAENLGEIKRRLRAANCHVPLCADIHFTPNAALEAARHVEKVRVNPGNYADRKRFRVFEVTDAAYQEGLEKVRELFLPLVHVLKEEGRALRIGTNHGSLSDRILNRFGDTPEGMVESALEFVRICRDESFHDIVLSMKSSIPGVMIAAYRLLVQRMAAEGMDYPLHVGVTEAGNGLEGRVKSAVGIGSLLASGIGDTIRVSLTEDSVHELGACRALLAAIEAERSVDGTTEGRATSSPRPTDPRGPHETGGVSGTADPDGAEASVGAVAPAVRDAAWRTLPATTAPERRDVGPWKLGRRSLGSDHPIAVELRVPLPLDGVLAPTWEERIARAGQEHGPEIVSVVPVGGCRMGQPTTGGPDPVPAVGLAHSHEVNWIEHLGELRRRLGIVPLIYEHRGPTPDDACLARLAGAVDGVSLRLPFELHGSASDDEGHRSDGDSAPSPGRPDESSILRIATWAAHQGCRLRWRLPRNHSADHALAASNLMRAADLPAAAFVCEPGPNWLGRTRALAAALPGDAIFLEAPALGAPAPVLAGSLLLDGIGDALCLVDAEVRTGSRPPWPGGARGSTNPLPRGSAGGVGARPGGGPADATAAWPPGGVTWTEDPLETAYHILQACRIRLTRTEFIACPSCGRTQFDLQTTTARIRARTGHLKGVKLAIMGCIVNGPGEMADADFGYVGSGAGRVDLYVGKERVAKNIPEAEAEERLVALLRERGVWVEP